MTYSEILANKWIFSIAMKNSRFRTKEKKKILTRFRMSLSRVIGKDPEKVFPFNECNKTEPIPNIGKRLLDFY